MATYILRTITPANSNNKLEETEVTEVDGFSERPLRSFRVYTSGWQKTCSCDGRDGTAAKQRNCVHVALWRTWSRQGRPQPKFAPFTMAQLLGTEERPAGTGFDAIRRYHVGVGRVIQYERGADIVSLSTVERVNGAPEEYAV